MKVPFLIVSFFLGCIVILMLMSLIGGFVARQAHKGTPVIGLTLKEAVLTSELDKNGGPLNQLTKFNRTQEHIYASIVVDSTLGLPVDGIMWTRWYYEGKQFSAHYVRPNLYNFNTISIEPFREGIFPPGKYKVDIYLDKPLVKTLEFEIE